MRAKMHAPKEQIHENHSGKKDANDCMSRRNCTAIIMRLISWKSHAFSCDWNVLIKNLSRDWKKTALESFWYLDKKAFCLGVRHCSCRYLVSWYDMVVATWGVAWLLMWSFLKREEQAATNDAGMHTAIVRTKQKMIMQFCRWGTISASSGTLTIVDCGRGTLISLGPSGVLIFTFPCIHMVGDVFLGVLGDDWPGKFVCFSCATHASHHEIHTHLGLLVEETFHSRISDGNLRHVHQVSEA